MLPRSTSARFASLESCILVLKSGTWTVTGWSSSRSSVQSRRLFRILVVCFYSWMYALVFPNHICIFCIASDAGFGDEIWPPDCQDRPRVRLAFLVVPGLGFELMYLVIQAPVLQNNCMALFLDMPSSFPCLLFRVSHHLHSICMAMKFIV